MQSIFLLKQNEIRDTILLTPYLNKDNILAIHYKNDAISIGRWNIKEEFNKNQIARHLMQKRNALGIKDQALPPNDILCKILKSKIAIKSKYRIT